MQQRGCPIQPQLNHPPVSLIQGAALFLDFDGTLVELASTPDAVVVDDGLRGLIRALSQQLDGRVAIVSGRPARQVSEMLSVNVSIVGSHGMEFMTDGVVQMPQRPLALSQIEGAARALADRLPGVLVEVKPLGVAIHYRQFPAAAAEAIALAEALAQQHGLAVQPGKMMIEVRAAGGDKGTAILRLLQEPNMVGARPVFMGDDHTDEPGFAAVEQMNGAGILVGEQRATAASHWLGGVHEARAWLDSVVQAA